MDKLIERFPAQMLEAVALTDGMRLSKRSAPIDNVLVCGLGGSGIGADLACDLTSDQITVPMLVNKSYELPAFAGPNTLLILCSYSGNTEETLSCANHAVARGLTAICISSGGKLRDLAHAHHFDFIQLPGGFPPRTTLGFSSTILLHILDQFALIDLTVSEEVTAASEFLVREQDAIRAHSETMAKHLKDKTVIVYAEGRIAGAALRLKQQINENSKSNCWINVVPELNHNELVGWKSKNETLAALFLRTSYENPRNMLRFDFIQPVVAEYVSGLHQVRAKGDSLMEQYFYLIHYGDWLSYYMGIERHEDPVEVRVIDKLKAHLSAVS